MGKYSRHYRVFASTIQVESQKSKIRSLRFFVEYQVLYIQFMTGQKYFTAIGLTYNSTFAFINL